MSSATPDFKSFLMSQVQLSESDVNLLLEGGFDDIDSLRLATADSLRFLGLSDAESIFARIKKTVGTSLEESIQLGVLNQDGSEIIDL